MRGAIGDSIISGGSYPIPIEMEIDDEPAGLDATIVYTVLGDSDNGSPDKVPMMGSNSSPWGSSGAIIHTLGPSPRNEGVSVVISTPTYKDMSRSP